MKVWGIHNDTLTTELLDDGFVSIGWDELSDLTMISGGREGLKSALTAEYSDDKPRAIAGWAGVLLRFRDEMQVGDVVVAPYRPDSTINIGLVTSDYYYEADAEEHQHRRRVEWKKIGLSRTIFSQPALYEIGSLLTVFRIRKHVNEFLAALEASDGPSSLGPHPTAPAAQAVETVLESEETDDSPDEPRASRIERHTRDFVLNALHRQISHTDFEDFTADLLRALGYQARVTAYSQDGGIDVIAHKDPLGVEPPQIKVQCKHLTGSVGAPDVQQLAGTLGHNELGLFVTLGTYTRDAQNIERQRSGLRLLNGEDVVSMVLANYEKLPQSWRSMLPLTNVLVVADTAE
jgi:restriction system protein